MTTGVSPNFRIDHEFLCRGVHFIIANSMTLSIECSWCDEPDSVFHHGTTYDASLSGVWIAKAVEHLITQHPDKIGH